MKYVAGNGGVYVSDGNGDLQGEDQEIEYVKQDGRCAKTNSCMQMRGDRHAVMESAWRRDQRLNTLDEYGNGCDTHEGDYKQNAKHVGMGLLHVYRGGMRPGLWTWEDQARPVTITDRPTPPTPPTEEIPEWALQNTPLQTTVPPEQSSLPPSEERSLPLPYVTKAHVSPSVRTDVSSVDLIVKPGTLVLHIRVRVASLLAVPPHRIVITDLDNNEMPLHHPVPTLFRVHDRRAAQSEDNDILDVYLGPMDRDSAFVFRVCRVWAHEQVLAKLASIIGVTTNNVVVTDTNGGEWRYPESKSTSMSVMLHTRRTPPVTPVPTRAVEESRGGMASLRGVCDSGCFEDEYEHHFGYVTGTEGSYLHKNDKGYEGGYYIVYVSTDWYHEEIEEKAKVKQHNENAMYHRGGMHLGHPIQDAHDDQDHQDPPLLPHEDLAEVAWEDDMRRPMRTSPPRSIASRSRSRDAPVPVLTDTARRLMQGLPSEYYDAWWAKETTIYAPSAERQLMSVLLVHDEHHVGYVWAYKTSYAQEIVKELMETLMFDSYVETVPAQARRRDEVARLTVPNPAVVTTRNPLDTRATRWEPYQAHREIPMLREGRVVRHAVVPKVASLRGCQIRLNMHAPWDETWKLMILDSETWVVLMAKLPGSVMRMIREYKSTLPPYLREGDDLGRDEIDIEIERGGMNNGQSGIQPGPWTWENRAHDQMENEDEEIPDWAISRTRREQSYQVRVSLAASIRSDLAYLTSKEDQVRTVGTLKLRLADILHTRKERIGVYSAENMHELLPEWQRTPTKVVIEDLMASPTPVFHYLNVYHRDAGQEFVLRIHYTLDNNAVRLVLGAIVREDPMNVTLFDHNGAPWVYPESMATCTAAVLVITERGYAL